MRAADHAAVARAVGSELGDSQVLKAGKLQKKMLKMIFRGKEKPWGAWN